MDAKRGGYLSAWKADLTKADFFQLNLSQIHGKIG